MSFPRVCQFECGNVAPGRSVMVPTSSFHCWWLYLNTWKIWGCFSRKT